MKNDELEFDILKTKCNDYMSSTIEITMEAIKFESLKFQSKSIFHTRIGVLILGTRVLSKLI